MAAMNFSPPPSLHGTEAAQLMQMHRFLFMMTEQLNAAQHATEQRAEAIAKSATTTAGGKPVKDALVDQYNSLQALIIKTADTIRHEMDSISANLASNYIAKSDWGYYEENIRAEMEATARGVVEEYDYEARIDSLDDQAAAFDTYMIESSGYIKRGIIGFDSEGFPIYGIAIGQDLKSTEITINGEKQEEIDKTNNMALYTSDRIEFWQGGVMVAYFSQNELNVTNISASDSIKIGGKWEISRLSGFTIKWIGG